MEGLRKAAGITQEVMGQALKMDQGNLSKVLKGKLGLTLGQAEAAAVLFNVTASWILFGEGQTPEEIAKAEERGRVEGWAEAIAALQAAAPARIVVPTPAAGTAAPPEIGAAIGAVQAQGQEQDDGQQGTG